MDRIAVIDLETTGLSPWRHNRVVEIGIVVISPDGTVHTEYETLVNPNRDVGPSCIHQISAADVLQAPIFADVAGDVLEILASANAVAGHNVSFDKNFLVKEYERIGVALPAIPLLCTCRLFGRGSLQACCGELGISFAGIPHRALSDARATAQIVSFICSDDPSILDHHRVNCVSWPPLSPLKTPCFRREHAKQSQDAPPRFLQRIATQTHHDFEAETPNVLAYMALIDRILEDRTIDQGEEDVLVDAALHWNLSPMQLATAHSQYLHNLVVAALADGIVTNAERRDLHMVAKLLGQDDSTLDLILESAASQLAAAHRGAPTKVHDEDSLRGQSVCFTGELQSTIGGEPITRDIAEALAANAGLTIASKEA
ncbi:MAG TPA: exonuclease domain-containing protein [Verrucomicrobiales bacterium]|nr:exonuclease domain-containing protein [Verrucomicrobiales bacterium]